MTALRSLDSVSLIGNYRALLDVGNRSIYISGLQSGVVNHIWRNRG